MVYFNAGSETAFKFVETGAGVGVGADAGAGAGAGAASFDSCTNPND